MNIFSLASREVGNRLIYSILDKVAKDGDFIVDNGCGVNDSMTYTKHKVYGLDIKQPDIFAASVDYISDSLNLPFKASSVDIFLSNWVIIHTYDKEKYLKEMHRTLKSEGYVILTTPMALWHLAAVLTFAQWKNIPRRNWRYFFSGGVDYKDEPITTFYREILDWRKSQWDKLFKKAKFDIVEKHITGNIFSMNMKNVGLLEKIIGRWGIHYTVLLKKVKNEEAEKQTKGENHFND